MEDKYWDRRDASGMSLLFLAIAITVVAGFASVLGGLLAIRYHNTETKYLSETIAAVAGFLLAVSFLDLIPEIAAESPSALVYVLVGYIAVYLAENLAPAHEHTSQGGHHTHHHDEHEHAAPNLMLAPHTGVAASFGLTLHSFFDGVALAASLQAGLPTALLLLAAVCIHQVPVGFGLAALMKASGNRTTAIMAALGSLLAATVAGGILSALLSFEVPGLEAITLAFSAGSFIYIGATDMIPSTHTGSCQRCVVSSLAGVLLFMANSWLFGKLGS